MVFDYGHTNDQPLNALMNGNGPQRPGGQKVNDPVPHKQQVGRGSRGGSRGRRWIRGLRVQGLGRGGHLIDRVDERVNVPETRRDEGFVYRHRSSSPADPDYDIFMDREREERCRNPSPDRRSSERFGNNREETRVFRGEETSTSSIRDRGYYIPRRGRDRDRRLDSRRIYGGRDERISRRPFHNSHSRERFSSGEPEIGGRVRRRSPMESSYNNYQGYAYDRQSRSRSPVTSPHSSSMSNGASSRRIETFVPRTNNQAESSSSPSNARNTAQMNQNETSNDPRLRRSSGSIYFAPGIAVKYMQAEAEENMSTLASVPPRSSTTTTTAGPSNVSQPSPVSSVTTLADCNTSSITGSPSRRVPPAPSIPNRNIKIALPRPTSSEVPNGNQTNSEQQQPFHVPVPSIPLPFSLDSLLEDESCDTDNLPTLSPNNNNNNVLATNPATVKPPEPIRSENEKEMARKRSSMALTMNILLVAKRDPHLISKAKALIQSQEKVLQNVENQMTTTAAAAAAPLLPPIVIEKNPGNCIIAPVPDRLKKSLKTTESPQKQKTNQGNMNSTAKKTTQSPEGTRVDDNNISKKSKEKANHKSNKKSKNSDSKDPKTSYKVGSGNGSNKRKRSKLTTHLFGSDTENDDRLNADVPSDIPSEHISDSESSSGSVVFVENRPAPPEDSLEFSLGGKFQSFKEKLREFLDKSKDPVMPNLTANATPQPVIQPPEEEEEDDSICDKDNDDDGPNSTQLSTQNNAHAQQSELSSIGENDDQQQQKSSTTTNVQQQQSSTATDIPAAIVLPPPEYESDPDERSYTLQICSPVHSSPPSPMRLSLEESNIDIQQIAAREPAPQIFNASSCPTTTVHDHSNQTIINTASINGNNSLSTALSPPARLEIQSNNTGPRSPPGPSAFTNMVSLSQQVFEQSLETSSSLVINPPSQTFVVPSASPIASTIIPSHEETAIEGRLQDNTPPQQQQPTENIPEIQNDTVCNNDAVPLPGTSSNNQVTPPVVNDDEDDDDDQDRPMVRIRSDLYSTDDRIQNIVKDLELKSKTVSSSFGAAMNDLNSALKKDSISEKFEKFKELRGTMIKCLCVLDFIDVQIEAEDIMSYGIPDSFNFGNVQRIPCEEMADYFLKILSVAFFLREPACANWKSNLMMLHYRLSRVLNYYVAGASNSKETEGNLQNIFIAINPRVRQFNIAFEELTRTWDHVRTFHLRTEVDKNCVLFEQSQVGFKGFSIQVDTIVCKVRGIVYRQKNNGMMPPPQDSAATNYSFENDMKILFEIRDPQFNNPQQHTFMHPPAT